MPRDDSFTLRCLEVIVEGDPKTFACDHQPGLAIRVVGEDLIFVNGRFSMYALAALLPLLPAKQREVHRNDWMGTDEIIACPDPNCKAKFRIRREGTGTSRHRHSETTKVQHPADAGSATLSPGT